MSTTKFETTKKWNRNRQTLKNLLRCSLFNARSLNNKTTFLRDYVIENEIDILFIAESWLCSSESVNYVTIRTLTPENSLIPPRSSFTWKRRGFAVLYRRGFTIIQQSTQNYHCFEYMCVVLKYYYILFRINLCYRPHPIEL